MKKNAIIVISCVIISVASCYWWRLSSYSRPRQEFMRLLAGDNGVHITSVKLAGENKRIVIDDPALTMYITGAFSFAVPDLDGSGGVSYDAAITLCSGDSVSCYIMFRDKRGLISVSEPIDVAFGNDPLAFYLIRLPEPIPDSLLEVLPRIK